MEGSNFTLYWHLGSQPSRAVKTLLLMGKVPHDEKSVDIMKGEHLQEDFLKINPRGLIPTIKDGDFVLYESNAILKYICETNASVPEHLWPKDRKLRALTDQYLEYYSFTFRPNLVAPIRLFFAKQRGAAVPEEVEGGAMEKLKECLNTFDKLCASPNGDFLVCDQPTIADLQCYFEITNLIIYRLPMDEWTNITAWYNKMSEVPEVKEVMDKWAVLAEEFKKIIPEAPKK
jgi:glutathione S-transferase